MCLCARMRVCVYMSANDRVLLRLCARTRTCVLRLAPLCARVCARSCLRVHVGLCVRTLVPARACAYFVHGCDGMRSCVQALARTHECL